MCLLLKDLTRFLWYRIVWYDRLLFYMIQYDIIYYNVKSCVIQYDIVSWYWYNMYSVVYYEKYCIMWYCNIFYIITCYCFIWYCNTKYCIIWWIMILYEIYIWKTYHTVWERCRIIQTVYDVESVWEMYRWCSSAFQCLYQNLTTI